KVVVKVIDPDKKPLPPYTLDLTPGLLPNQTMELSLPSSLIPPLSSLNKMGIYRIDYELHDNSGNTIQPQTEGSQFAISQHHIPENRLKGYKIWAVADENAVKGAKVAYTIFIKNDTDEDVVNGNIGVGVHEKGGRWWAHIGTITGINVPAHSQKSFPYEREVYLSTSTYFGLYLGMVSNTYFFQGAVARCEHGVWIVEAEVNLNMTPDKKIYDKGETVYITLKMTNEKSIEYDTNLQLKVMNPDNAVIFATNTTLLLTSKGSVSISFDVPLSKDAVEGIYIIQAEANRGGKKIGLDTTWFKILEGIPGLELTLPEPVIPNSTNTITFTLTNLGLSIIESSTLTVSFIDPDKTLLWHGTSTFSAVAIAGSSTLNIKIPIKMINFGIYELFYTLSYKGKIWVGSKEIKYDAIIKVEPDKTKYRVREELMPKIEIINTGKFKQDLQIISFIDKFNFRTTTALSLLPSQKGSFTLTTFIPVSATAGYHYGTVCLQIGTSTKFTQFKFYIPPAELKIELEKKDYIIGDMVNVTISNIGGVDESCDYKIKLADSMGLKIYEENNRIDKIESGKNQIISFLISDQAVTDNYVISMEYYGEERGTKTVFLPLKIT
ncbi:MAG: hypothetical protein AB1414_20185, partial [bacterium]